LNAEERFIGGVSCARRCVGQRWQWWWCSGQRPYLGFFKFVLLLITILDVLDFLKKLWKRDDEDDDGRCW